MFKRFALSLLLILQGAACLESRAQETIQVDVQLVNVAFAVRDSTARWS